MNFTEVTSRFLIQFKDYSEGRNANLVLQTWPLTHGYGGHMTERRAKHDYFAKWT